MRRSQRQNQAASQANYNESTQDDEKQNVLKTAVSQLVVYVLHNLDNSKILRRTVIQKHVAVKGINWNKQLDAANKRLQEVYGCSLEICDDPSVKQPSYYIRKLTPHIILFQENDEEKRKKILTLMAVSIVFMSNGKCSEAQFWQCFEKLNLTETDEDDDLNDLLKELHTRSILHIENQEISWGPLADVLVNKMEVLKFVSKVYNTSLNSWGELYIKACEQTLTNGNYINNEENGVEEENGIECSQ